MAYDPHSEYQPPPRAYYSQQQPAGPYQDPHYNNGYAQEQGHAYDGYSQNGYQGGYQEGYYDDQYGQVYGAEQYQGPPPPIPQRLDGGTRMIGGQPPQAPNFSRGPPRPVEQSRGMPPRGPPGPQGSGGYGSPMRARGMSNATSTPRGTPPQVRPGGTPRQGYGPAGGGPMGRGGGMPPPNAQRQMPPPEAANFDNPFPAFPMRKSPPRAQGPPIDDRMANMSIQEGRPSGDYPRPSGDYPRPSGDFPRPMQHDLDSITPRPSVEAIRPPWVGGARPFSPLQEVARTGAYSPAPGGRPTPPLQEPFEHRPIPPQRSQTVQPANEIGGFRMPFASSPPGFRMPFMSSPPEPRGPQRSMTMPQNHHDSMQSIESSSSWNDREPSWAEPGPMAGYHGPEDPSFIPRPGTAGGSRKPQIVDPTAYNVPFTPPRIEDKREMMGSIENAYHPPPMPNINHMMPPEDNRLQNMTSRDAAIEAEMPDFDNIDPSATTHKRGLSFEKHLQSPPGNAAGGPQPMPFSPPTLEQRGRSNTGGSNFNQQVHRSRSQPDLNRGNPGGNGFVAEMPGDAPPIPQLPRSNTFGQGYTGPGQEPPPRPNTAGGRRPGPAPHQGFGGPHPPHPPLPGQQPRGPPQGPPQGRGPPPGHHPRGPPPPGARFYNGPPNPNYPPMQRSNTDQMRPTPGQDPRFNGPPPQSAPPDHRARGPPPMRNGPPNGPPMPNGPNGPMRNGPPPGMRPPPGPRNAGPSPGPVEPQPRQSEDSLPHHPTPVRAGLMDQAPPQQQQQPTSNKPPPVRQYNGNANTPVPGGPSANIKKGRRMSDPITMDGLARARNDSKNKPEDKALQLRFAKKLVEAAAVLADEGGRADPRTRNKNRERYTLEAHKIVKKLVHQGYGEAQFYLADCYGSGNLGLESDPKEAFALYMSAAKAGHAASAYRTAVCCEMGAEEGGGTRKDPLKAVQWYKRAASLGDTPAMYKMGMIQLKGLLGQQKSVGEAVTWLKRAAERADEENPHALHELGLLYSTKAATSREEKDKIIRDETYAFELFKQAAELGYKFSQFRLGEAYEYGMLGCAIDARNSIAWYTRAAAQEEHQSELALSGWYLTGSAGILDQSDTEAYLWARKAACADPPLAKAMFAMGYFTEVGIGCPRSLEEAKRWYGRAASYKFPKAQERLEELKRGGARAQKGRERLSRSNRSEHEENCVVM